MEVKMGLLIHSLKPEIRYRPNRFSPTTLYITCLIFKNIGEDLDLICIVDII